MKVLLMVGGLGNQMFQYAMYLYLKSKFYPKDIYIDISHFYKHDIVDIYEIERIFKINPKTKKIFYQKNFLKDIFFRILKKILFNLNFFYEEKRNLNAEENLKRIRDKNIFFSGNWISEKYFYEIKEEVRKSFIFPKILDKKNLEIKKIIEETESVSIHVRRTDYLLEKHKVYSGLVELSYYEEAINIINKRIKNPVYFVFSDDIEWCKKNLKIANSIYYIDWNKGKENYRDMQLMSLCKHNIIPHSTFSWWGAWLNQNPNKMVIAPKVWFNPKYLTREINMEDIVPKDWIKIVNYKGDQL